MIFGQAWFHLLQAAPTFGDVASYQFDIVDVGRQVLSYNFTGTLAAYRQSVANHDVDETKMLAARLLETIDDYETLLATNEHFLLGRWLKWARAWGTDEAEQAQLEYNARNLLTLWGPQGIAVNDYARKEWSGLVSSYYRKRWALLLAHVAAAMDAGVSWNSTTAAVYCKALHTVMMAWPRDETAFPSEPTGDAVDVAKAMYVKYV